MFNNTFTQGSFIKQAVTMNNEENNFRNRKYLFKVSQLFQSLNETSLKI